MQMAYLILAHKNPTQVKRLAKRLCTEDSFIFIHLDQKTLNMADYMEVVKNIPNTSFIKQRVDVRWGAYSMIDATLKSLKEIMESGRSFDYIHLVSGQDYPLKSNTMIFNFFNKHKGKEFLSYQKLPTAHLPLGGTDRFEYYYDYDNPYCSFDSPNSEVYEMEMRRRGIKRNFIKGMTPYHGSQWWSLTGDCIRYILDKVAKDKEIANFYRYTKFPDEQFFQTVVMNSEYAKNVINDNFRGIDWQGIDWSKEDWKVNPPHPRTLLISDFPYLTTSNRLFGRKFDITVDKRVLDRIDTMIM